MPETSGSPWITDAMNPQPHILQHIFRVSAAAHLDSKKSIELRAEHYD
jgi:hypothetical protein